MHHLLQHGQTKTTYNIYHNMKQLYKENIDNKDFLIYSKN